jgi:hypothetical protein
MKQVLLAITILGMSLASCEKQEDCNCGLITDDGNGNGHYWIEIRNNCSDNVKRFYLTQGDWMNAHPGNQYCITNTQPW